MSDYWSNYEWATPPATKEIAESRVRWIEKQRVQSLEAGKSFREMFGELVVIPASALPYIPKELAHHFDLVPSVEQTLKSALASPEQCTSQQTQ